MITYRYKCLNGKNDTVFHEKKQVGAKKLDEKVENLVNKMIKNIKPKEFEMNFNEHKNLKIAKKIELQKLKEDISDKYKRLNVLNDEVPNALLGESSFTPQLLSKNIKKVEDELNLLEKQMQITKEELDKLQYELHQLKQLEANFVNWEEKFKNANVDEKKVMLSIVLSSVDYKKDMITLNVSSSCIKLLNPTLIDDKRLKFGLE